MDITCISDLHGHLPELGGGDLLIMCGDYTASDKVPQWKRFYDWVRVQKYEKIIYIAGNHDGFLKQCINGKDARELGIYEEEEPAEYLLDSGIEYKGLKIWGSPWTPEFCGWDFMKNDRDLKEHWDMIPDDTEILITHGPPFGMLDKTEDDKYAGSRTLSDRIQGLKKLKLHVFGHIHEGYGKCYAGYEQIGPITANSLKDMRSVKPIGHYSVNCSLMDARYRAVNAPVRVIL